MRSSIPTVTAPPFSPDQQQRRVLDHREGALSVMGGAGSGKTATLRERFARLVEGEADPERTVLVVGSAAARDGAKTALLDRLPTSLPGLQVVTIHGLANRVLRQRLDVLGYAEPPRVLGAPEHFALVRDLLANEDPTAWPAYGSLLKVRGFVDEVRQFLVRAQEEMRTPQDVERAADARSLSGWHELARFLSAYQAVLDDLNAVDFGALVQRAALVAPRGDPPFDHVMVDDFQDATFAAEALLRGLQAPDLVVSSDAAAHLFSFQGRTRVPLDRFDTSFPGAKRIELLTNHRAPREPSVQAWVAPHTSEEHAAVAREIRRLHVEGSVPWSTMAVIVRRQGAHVDGLLRALDDAGIPRAVPERGLALSAEPATRPYVLALRWLVADAPRREELIEQLLVSDVVGLSPATARGLLRAARADAGSSAEALAPPERADLSDQERSALLEARDALTKASLFAGMSVQDAFRQLWEDLPCSRELVERASASMEARRELDTVVMFANAVAEADGTPDASVQAFLDRLDAGEHGPGRSAWERARPDAVAVLTAHGAVGREFDAVIVTGVNEGTFPSLSRPEPMFDLAVLDHVVTNASRNRERLEDERRLFDSVIARARDRVVLVCADTHQDAGELSTRSRFVAERGIPWSRAPQGPFDEPVSVREATATWRRALADPGVADWRRLAALEGLVSLGVDPSRWWFQRSWTDTGNPLHETIRVSYSRLSNLEACELKHVLGDELGLGRPGGYQAWVGKTVHRLIEDAERGTVSKEPAALVAALDERWRPQEFPSRAVSEAFRSLARNHMLRNWSETYGERPALGIEQYFEFEFEGVSVIGYIDRIGPSLKDGTTITDFKTGKSDNAEPPQENLQLGIYYLAVQESEALAAFKPVRQVELAFLRGNWRNPQIEFRKMPINERDEERYQSAMRERLSQLIRRKKELDALEIYRPNPYANCRFCDFKTLCPLYPEGQPVFPIASVRRTRAQESA